MRHKFKSTRQRLLTNKIFGFDIETYDDNKGFLLAGIYGRDERYNRDYFKTFYSKKELFNELRTNHLFRNSILYATNLSFDFWGSFFGEEEAGAFRTCDRNGKLLSAKTFFKGLNENTIFVSSGKKPTKSKQSYKSLEFIDTMNYAQMSVAQMGKLLKIPKLKSPIFGKSWKEMTEEEKDYMIIYNKRDCEVSYKFMKDIFIPAFESLGASVNLTIGSTAMSLFKNKYLGDRVVHPCAIHILRRLFLGFYGGRTEIFSRGSFVNANYYDFNSLYPSVMHDYEFPDPNSMRVSKTNRQDYIMHCEGVSEVEITIPKMHIPPLPYRHDGKLIFPYGKLRGSWSHIELRHAVENCGCTITKVYESIYYVVNCKPFKQFVSDLYSKRLEYQAEEEYNPMEKVVKLLMNNLFGKFAEQFDERGKNVHKNAVTEKDLEKSIKFQVVGEFFKIISNEDPKPHCIPIWALYVTAYGRVKMHKAMMSHQNIIYCDTDSLITHDTIPTSNKLGDLKLERDIAFGLCIKPKMYATFSSNGDDFVKMKGLARKYQPKSFKEFSEDFIKSPMRTYHHFIKFNEAIRNGRVVPNQITLKHKNFSLEDNKRNWKFKFNTKGENGIYEFQTSEPLCIEDGKIKMQPCWGNQETSHRVANLKESRKPTIRSGVNKRGEVAPTMKYENINITDPKTPIKEDS